MGRKVSQNDREILKDAIENHPLHTKGFFARLLNWHPQKVEREMAYLENDRYLLTEDDKHRIAPFEDQF